MRQLLNDIVRQVCRAKELGYSESDLLVVINIEDYQDLKADCLIYSELGRSSDIYVLGIKVFISHIPTPCRVMHKDPNVNFPKEL